MNIPAEYLRAHEGAPASPSSRAQEATSTGPSQPLLRSRTSNPGPSFPRPPAHHSFARPREQPRVIQAPAVPQSHEGAEHLARRRRIGTQGPPRAILRSVGTHQPESDTSSPSWIRTPPVHDHHLNYPRSRRDVGDTTRADSTDLGPHDRIEEYPFAAPEVRRAPSNRPALPTITELNDLNRIVNLLNASRARALSRGLGGHRGRGLPATDTISHRLTIASQGMTAHQMLDCLVGHGCIDLTSYLVPNKTSPGLVTGGAFGDIWKGELSTGTEVAIKVWRFASVEDEDEGKSLKRAMREIYNWSKLEHRNIQKLLGVTLHQGRLGMVSRWMENGNLRIYLRKNPHANRYKLCIQAVSSIDYLHLKNMVHGDIKAVNFLVSERGLLKLTDFDHSIMSNCSLQLSETSRIGGGTARWMAPELLIEDPCQQRNKQTDIYALGMTLLEIVTGKVPYESECKNDVAIVRILDKKIPPKRTEEFEQIARGCNLWDCMEPCWDHDPDARPTASQLFLRLSTIPLPGHPHSCNRGRTCPRVN